MTALGACGETSERVASRAHRWAEVIMALCLAAEVAACIVHAVMWGFHRASADVHLDRARAKGD